MKFSRGFSLLELLVVLVILGLLASLVIPNVLGKMDAAKHRALAPQIARLQSGIDSFTLDVGRLPVSLSELVESPSGAEYWAGPYVKGNALKGPWGRSFIYKILPDSSGYEVVSYGRDNQVGGAGVNVDVSSNG